MKKIFFLFVSLLTTEVASAQDTAVPLKSAMTDQLFLIYLLTSFILIVILLVLVVAVYMLRVLNLFVQKAEEGKAAKQGIVYVPQPNILQRFWEQINASVPVEKEATIELDHNYDGIKELDNHLPPWWKWLFYGTIVWGIVYIVVYHITDSLPLSLQEYNEEVAVAQASIQKYKASQPVSAVDESKLEFTNDVALIEQGKKVFLSNCASCHKDNGAGNVGPNLTDNYWLHGGSIKDIYSTIKNGVPDKGMISWAPILKPDEIKEAAFFIMSLKGTNPPGGKAPQGDLFKPEVITTKVDSVKTSLKL